jgi:hypothetical protein
LSVVCVVCCQVEVSATNWSLVHRSPTDCGASLWLIKKPRERGGHSPRWAAEPEKIIIIIINIPYWWSYAWKLQGFWGTQSVALPVPGNVKKGHAVSSITSARQC